jgi:hypothetical protein
MSDIGDVGPLDPALRRVSANSTTCNARVVRFVQA